MMIKHINFSSVKFLFGSIYTVVTIIGFTLIALILPYEIDSRLGSFFNDTLIPSIQDDGRDLS